LHRRGRRSRYCRYWNERNQPNRQTPHSIIGIKKGARKSPLNFAIG
jgi:hypothetical protein